MADELELRTHARYGWKPSLPDARDLIADTSEIKILPEVDPRPQMPGVYDQEQLGSCTANAIGAAIEYDAERKDKTAFPTRPSRLFIYYGERAIEGSINEDAGAFGRDGFKVAKTVGVPDEKFWKYDTSRFAEKPPKEAYAEAVKHKIGYYKAVRRRLTDFKAALSNGQTIAFGFSVYESFEGDELARTGIMPMPVWNERVLGGHEVLGIGYLKSEPHYMLCRNSWGTGWGLGGYFLMPWAVLLDPQMSSDFRTIYHPLGA